MCASGRKHYIIIYSKKQERGGWKEHMRFKTDRLAAENLLSGVLENDPKNLIQYTSQLVKTKEALNVQMSNSLFLYTTSLKFLPTCKVTKLKIKPVSWTQHFTDSRFQWMTFIGIYSEVRWAAS